MNDECGNATPFFVVYYGDTDKNPLDHGVDMWYSKDGAIEFARIWTKKGYRVEIYRGVYFDH